MNTDLKANYEKIIKSNLSEATKEYLLLLYFYQEVIFDVGPAYYKVCNMLDYVYYRVPSVQQEEIEEYVKLYF